MNERQSGSVIIFPAMVVNFNDPSHTPLTRLLLLTQDCDRFRCQRILALLVLQISQPLSYEKTMHSVESYLTDDFYVSSTCSPVCKYICFI